MTWASSTSTHVKCDSGGHRGESTFAVVHGVAVTAEQALKAKGWRYNRALNTHVCPECVARHSRARMN